MFSVYDRDETMGAIYGSQVDPLEEDEFLGRASVDISYLISALVLVKEDGMRKVMKLNVLVTIL